MKILSTIALLFVLPLLPVTGYSQPTCVAPALSDQQVNDIIGKERAARTDLPTPFAEFESKLSRQGCHYSYIEYGIPAAFHTEHIFILNQHGVIVDVQSGAETDDLECPDKVLAKSALAEIVNSERGKRDDLPAPYPEAYVRVSRSRCMYRYFEHALPEERGKYQVFTIDPFGELFDFSVSQPFDKQNAIELRDD